MFDIPSNRLLSPPRKTVKLSKINKLQSCQESVCYYDYSLTFLDKIHPSIDFREEGLVPIAKNQG